MRSSPVPGPELITDLTIDAALPAAPFREHHHRIVGRPIDEVWPHCVAVTAAEIRTLGPLMALRGFPARLRGRPAPHATVPAPLLEVFADEGFVMLRHDAAPVDGRAQVLFGAAGVFWSVTENAPKTFTGAADFLDFDEPGHAVTVARLEAIDLGDGTTRIETETRVTGTDPASTRKFAPYWAVIRLPSGLIRRSWLAAIDRRATA